MAFVVTSRGTPDRPPPGYTFRNRQDISPNSDSVRCFYHDPTVPSMPVSEYICGRTGGCCDYGCCPTEPVWIGGIIVLCVFVGVLIIVSIIIGVVCLIRSKSIEKRERLEKQQQQQQFESYPPSIGPPLGTYYTGTIPRISTDQRYNMFETGGGSMRRY